MLLHKAKCPHKPVPKGDSEMVDPIDLSNSNKLRGETETSDPIDLSNLARIEGNHETLAGGVTHAGSTTWAGGASQPGSATLAGRAAQSGFPTLTGGPSKSGSANFAVGATQAVSATLAGGATQPSSPNFTVGATQLGSANFAVGATQSGSVNFAECATQPDSATLAGGTSQSGSPNFVEGATQSGSANFAGSATQSGSANFAQGTTQSGSANLAGGTTQSGSADLAVMTLDKVDDFEDVNIDLIIHTHSNNSHGSLTCKRDRYPFDMSDNDEVYMSEHEESDSMIYTRERREIKDRLELELRKLDKLESPQLIGQAEVVEKFLQFIEQVHIKDDRGYGNINVPSTGNINAKILVNDILQAFNSHYEPFNANWIIDCKSEFCSF